MHKQQLLELTPEECKWSLLLYWVKWECEKSWALTCYAIEGSGG